MIGCVSTGSVIGCVSTDSVISCVSIGFVIGCFYWFCDWLCLLLVL